MKQILIFILFLSMLCWLMFSPIYKHVLIVRQAVLQKEVDLLLEFGTNASHGYIDTAMVNGSKQRLIERGFNSENLIYTISTTNGTSGSNPSAPVIRGEGIQLRISYPYEHLLQIDRLIGMNSLPADARMAAGGMKMSEFVP